MNEKKDIRTETQFLLKFVWKVLCTPVVLVLALFGKRQMKDVFAPIHDFYLFLKEPKFTWGIFVVTIFTSFFAWLILSEGTVSLLLNYPSDVVSMNRWYSFVSSGFLHGSLSHLLGNMVALLIFGRIVEMHLGPWKTALVYFSSMIISAAANSAVSYVAFGTNIPALGASGAIMGLVAAAMLLDPLVITWEAVIPLPVMVLGWLAIVGDISGILTPINDGIAHGAHIFGFLSITFSMRFLSPLGRERLKKGFYINLISAAVALIYLFARSNGLV